MCTTRFSPDSCYLSLVLPGCLVGDSFLSYLFSSLVWVPVSARTCIPGLGFCLSRGGHGAGDVVADKEDILCQIFFSQSLFKAFNKVILHLLTRYNKYIAIQPACPLAI